MKQGIAKYLFYTAALAVLIAPFASHAAGSASDPAPAMDQVGPGWDASDRGPGDGPRMVRRPMLRERIARRAFEELDANGDGKIDSSEFQAPRKDRFAAIDQNGDGAITIKEIKKYRERAAEERLEKRFAALDRDGDGKVTRDEIRAQRFARLDRNGDGYLSPRELRGGRGAMPPAPPLGE